MKLAKRTNFLAHPRQDRLHKSPVPMLGGLGIVGSFYLMLGIHYFVVKFMPDIFTGFPEWVSPFVYGINVVESQFAFILMGGVIVFFAGLLDDIKTLRPLNKLLFQIILGIGLYVADVRITVFCGPGLLSMFITVFWVVAITNAFNLLDNIDGLSAGVGAIASFILFLQCVQGGQILVALLLIIFIGSLCGYLVFNYPPAKIFMGDAGSLFIGYFISVLTIKSTFYFDKDLSLVPFATPLVILAVPIYDTVSVIIIRLKNKKPIFAGDKNHFSHRLLRAGMSNRQAVNFIYLVAICLGIAALAMKSGDLQSQVILLIQAGGLLTMIYLMERIKINKNL